jgi:hypothetical protein
MRCQKAGVKDNSIHCLPDNTVGYCYSAVQQNVDAINFQVTSQLLLPFSLFFSFLKKGELLSHQIPKAHCFLACWGINFTTNSVGTPLNSVQAM